MNPMLPDPNAACATRPELRFRRILRSRYYLLSVRAMIWFRNRDRHRIALTQSIHLLKSQLNAKIPLFRRLLQYAFYDMY